MYPLKEAYCGEMHSEIKWDDMKTYYCKCQQDIKDTWSQTNWVNLNDPDKGYHHYLRHHNP